MCQTKKENHFSLIVATPRTIRLNTKSDSLFFLTDNEPPVVICPSDSTVYTDTGKTFYTLLLREADSVNDNSGVTTLTIEVNGSSYQPHDVITLSLRPSPHLLRYTATDGSNYSASCDAYVIVKGTLVHFHYSSKKCLCQTKIENHCSLIVTTLPKIRLNTI